MNNSVDDLIAPPKQRGRTSIKTPELIDQFCAEIAIGKSVREICETLPVGERTIFQWLEDDESFQQQYARAKLRCADFYARECLAIADDGLNDWMEQHNKDGECVGWMVNGEHVQRSRLRVDVRKWHASKLAPKVYGDKTIVAGDEENPVRIISSDLSTDEMYKRMIEREGKVE